MSILPRRSTLALLAACGAAVAALAAPAVAPAQDVIVRFKPGVRAGERAHARRGADVVHQEALPVSGMEVVEPEPETSVADAVADLQRSPDVLYAEPNRRRTIAKTASDPKSAMEWGLSKISALTAWDTTTGDRAVTVGVIDTGIALTHPDLAPNVWTNPGEVAGNGKDDDGDGYVDDVRGWDFVDGDADPNDLNGHGTHVAGTIAANGDDAIGVAGVAWQAGLVPLRVLDASGDGRTSNIIKAYAYAQQKGVRIVNLSLGGPDFDQAEYDAMRAAKDVLFVVAAGNTATNNDTTPLYPCSYDLPNIVCVAATTSTDSLAPFSNFGAASVDLAAPGQGILSTYPPALDTGDGVADGYTPLNGTSMATPHVAGAAALLLSNDRTLTPWQLGQVLVKGSDSLAGLAGKVASGGRLNVAGALAATPPPASSAPAVADPTPTPVILPPPAASGVPPAAQPTPTPTPARSAPAVDRTAPGVTLAVPARGGLAALLARRLRVTARSSEAGRVRLELRLDRRTAKRLHLRSATATVRIATGSAAFARPGSAKVTLRLTSKAKRALARARNVKATLVATASDAAGNRATRTRTLTLRRVKR